MRANEFEENEKENDYIFVMIAQSDWRVVHNFCQE